MVNEDKILGMFAGIFIGDRLGLPVEGKTTKEIQSEHGRISDFLGDKTSDDWQLSVAVARGLIAGLHGTKKLQNRNAAVAKIMDAMAVEHAKAAKESTFGWGASTKISVFKVAQGIHWSESGNLMGMGNGVAMKVGPISAYSAFVNNAIAVTDAIELTMKLGTMTHIPWVASAAGLAQMEAVRFCLLSEKNQNFDTATFVESVNAIAGMAISLKQEGISCPDICDRLILLKEEYSTERIIKELGGGFLAYDSIPFSLMFFLKNPFSLGTLFDVVNAGGDTDSNGSMVGALLGALNGYQIFAPLIAKLSDDERMYISGITSELLTALENFVAE